MAEMTDLAITTFLWGDKYNELDVRKLAGGFRRHLRIPYRFVLFSDRKFNIEGVECHSIPDMHLTERAGCFARLRLFDPEFQREMGFYRNIVCTDLDSVITGSLDALFKRKEPFVILQGANAVNPCPYVGALMMLKHEAHPEVWNEFTFERAEKVPFHEFPDDQGWLWHMVPNAAGWKAGENGVYAFQKPGWPKGSIELPRDARIVTFLGWRKPRKYYGLPWIRQNWVP